MRSIFILTFLAIFNFSIGCAAGEQPVVGLWKTQDQRAKIEITSCAKDPSKICGTIVELREPIDPDTGKPKKDKLNPDSSLKEREILGLVTLYDFKSDSDNPNHWTDGKIYNSREGETYSCEMTLIDANTLEVHGYVGLPIFGKTQKWSRTTKDEKLIATEDAEK